MFLLENRKKEILFQKLIKKEKNTVFYQCFQTPISCLLEYNSAVLILYIKGERDEKFI